MFRREDRIWRYSLDTPSLICSDKHTCEIWCFKEIFFVGLAPTFNLHSTPKVLSIAIHER